MESANSQISVWTMACQAVLLCPNTQSSAMYYKRKLQVQNFTLFNIKAKDRCCYLCDEAEGDLSGDMFAYLQYHHFSGYLDAHPEINTLIIWSDGCMYQNKKCDSGEQILSLVQNQVCVHSTKVSGKGSHAAQM